LFHFINTLFPIVKDFRRFVHTGNSSDQAPTGAPGLIKGIFAEEVQVPGFGVQRAG
jgi:hypothetical protein